MSKKRPGPGEYRCEACKGIFKKGWSDAEALEEFQRDFPNVSMDDTGIVCDKCYKLMQVDIKLNPWKYPKL